MKITKIYQHYHIPQSLQQHMLTVAAVGQCITDYWQGPEINSHAITTTLLVHDLGNLVKFDLSESAAIIDRTLFAQEWRERQRLMREQYGTDSHLATQAILRELRLPAEVQTLANGMDADDLCLFLETPLAQQICEYADIRVVPAGVTSLLERLQDFRRRYAHYDGWSTEEKYQRNVECAQQLEGNLQRHITENITAIPPEKIQAYLVKLRQFEIAVN